MSAPRTTGPDAGHVLVIAGEASGDRHAARLIESLKELRPGLRFSGIGGDRMREQGVELLYHASQTNVIGFLEVVRRYRFLRSVFLEIVQHARATRPTLAILVDYPGFNLRLARELRALGIPVVYYIAPQVWAWKEGRVNTLRECVDDLIVVFPFEVEYFSERGIPTHFFGHPLIDQHQRASTNEGELKDRPVIAYLPGSRPEELRRHMPVIRQVIEAMGNSYRHVIPRAPTLALNEIERFRGGVPFEVVESTGEALSVADAALVKSGTSTVETALHGVPFAVFYKTSAISYQIALRAIKVPSIAMVNLLAQRPIVREFVQSGATAEHLVRELQMLLGDEEYRERIRRELAEIAASLGEGGAARRGAEHIAERFL